MDRNPLFPSVALRAIAVIASVTLAYAFYGTATSQASPQAGAGAAESDSTSTLPEKAEPKLEPLPELSSDWKPLAPKDSIEKLWINTKLKQVAIDGEVCLTRGYLEMFACVKNTKEHESVVSLKAKAFKIDATLRALGAKPGSPARWDRGGRYSKATGPVIKVIVEWMSDGKPKRIQAQHWVRDLKTKKAMSHDWVFGGSSTWKDPETGKNYYRADGGEVICVSNFPVAMMDLPIESSQANEELAFEALTENIPPRRTPVRVYLAPVFPEAKKEGTSKKEATSK